MAGFPAQRKFAVRQYETLAWRPAAFCLSSKQSGREVGGQFPRNVGALAPRKPRGPRRERIAPATPKGVTRATRYRRGAHDRRANACSQRPGGGWPVEGNLPNGTREKKGDCFEFGALKTAKQASAGPQGLASQTTKPHRHITAVRHDIRFINRNDRNRRIP
jgi:hypothetical protein